MHLARAAEYTNERGNRENRFFGILNNLMSPAGHGHAVEGQLTVSEHQVPKRLL